MNKDGPQASAGPSLLFWSRVMSSQTRLEERVSFLEQEVARLRTKLDRRSDAGSWVDEVSGSFEGDEAFREILKLGRQERDSQPTDSEA